MRRYLELEKTRHIWFYDASVVHSRSHFTDKLHESSVKSIQGDGVTTH